MKELVNNIYGMSMIRITLFWVLFLMASTPTLLYAQVITSVKSGAENGQNIILSSPDSAFATPASLTTDSQPLRAAAGIATEVSGLSVSAATANAENKATADDIANVRSSGSPSSQSGAFEYVYPIDVPSGRNGLTPEVSLQYSSNNTDSLDK